MATPVCATRRRQKLQLWVTRNRLELRRTVGDRRMVRPVGLIGPSEPSGDWMAQVVQKETHRIIGPGFVRPSGQVRPNFFPIEDQYSGLISFN